MSFAFTVLEIVSPVSFLVKESSQSWLLIAASIKASVTFIEIFAKLHLFKSVLKFMKSITSGCVQSNVRIAAPRLEFCAIDPVTADNNSINGVTPSECLAEFRTIAPFGANLLKSVPAPPPYENVRAIFVAHSKIDSIESSGGVIT